MGQIFGAFSEYLYFELIHTFMGCLNVYIILSFFYLDVKEVFAKYVGVQWIAPSTFSFPERVSLRPSKWLLEPL